MTIPRNLSNLAPGASTSGVLDTAHGGTGTSTTFTTGSVPFAGASGVYTQDNAKLFWDNTNKRLGIGTATPGEQLSIAADSPTFSMSTPIDGNRVEQRYYNEGTQVWTVGLNYGGGDGHYFIERDFGGGNLLLVPDGNGNVGIGTASPNLTAAGRTTVDINGSTQSTLSFSSAGANVGYLGATSNTNLTLSSNSTGAYDLTLQYGNNLITAQGGTERSRFNNIGNLGIGTPSPVSYGTDITTVAVNGINGSYFDQMVNGSTQGQLFSTASETRLSRLSNYPITFYTNSSEKMRLTGAGNLVIAGTAARAVLDVQGQAATAVQAVLATGVTDGNFQLWAQNGVAGTATGTLQAKFALAYSGVGYCSGFSFYRGSTANDGALGILTSNTERVYIDPVGNVGIGTNTPNNTATDRVSVDINGTLSSLLNLSYGGTSAGYLVGSSNSITLSATARPLVLQQGSYLGFWRGATEDGRFDTNGNFLVGTTVTNPIASAVNGIATGPIGFMTIRGANNMALGVSGGSGTHFQFYTDGGTLTSAGNIASSGATTAYNTSSDIRLKTNITPLAGSADRIDAIEVVDFDWKSGGKGRGVIAQDVYAIDPMVVTPGSDDTVKQGTFEFRPWSVDYSKFVPDLIVCVQELRKEVASLRAELNAIKGA